MRFAGTFAHFHYKRLQLPANPGDRDAGLTLGSGRSPGVGNGNPLQYSCLKIPWTEEPGGLQAVVSQRVRHN